MSKLLKIFAQVHLLRIVVFSNSFFALLFRFADANLKDSLLILIVVNAQISLGGLIWTMMRSQSSIDLVEFVGMGGAFGFGLSLISSQLFRTFVPFSISWLILPVLSLVVLQIRGGCSLRVSLAKLQAPSDLLLIFSGTLIALSTSWYWLVSTALAVFLWTVLHYLRESNRSADVSQSKWQAVIALAAVAMSVRAVLHLSALAELRNPLWWNLRFGVMQDPDMIFAESMVNSTRHLGYQGKCFRFRIEVLLPLVCLCMGSHLRFNFAINPVCDYSNCRTGNRFFRSFVFGIYHCQENLSQFVFGACSDVFSSHVVCRANSFF